MLACLASWPSSQRQAVLRSLRPPRTTNVSPTEMIWRIANNRLLPLSIALAAVHRVLPALPAHRCIPVVHRLRMSGAASSRLPKRHALTANGQAAFLGYDPFDEAFGRSKMLEELPRLLPDARIPLLELERLRSGGLLGQSLSDPELHPPYDIQQVTEPMRVVHVNLAHTVGLAVGRNNWLVMVPTVVLGEEVTAKVYSHGDGVSLGDLVQVVKPSRDRIQAPCQYFEKCGGCHLQHLPYERQLSIKQDYVRKVFEERLLQLPSHASASTGTSTSSASAFTPGHSLDTVLGRIVASPKEFGYRSKLAPHFSSKEHGASNADAVGFTQRGRRMSVLDVEQCAVAMDTVNAEYRYARDSIKKLRRYQSAQKPQGHVIIRHTQLPPNGLVFSDFMRSFISARKGAQRDTSDSVDQHTLEIAAASGISPPVPQLTSLWDQGATSGFQDIVLNIVDNIAFRFPSIGFFQANMSVLPLLTQHIRDAINKVAGPKSQTEYTLVDAYAGAGFFTLILASLFQRVIGIENVRQSVLWANKNMADNKIFNASFVSGSVEDLLKNVIQPLKPERTVVLLNPPRAGMHANACNALRQFGPKMMIYISCNVDSQVRDVSHLLGYPVPPATKMDAKSRKKQQKAEAIVKATASLLSSRSDTDTKTAAATAATAAAAAAPISIVGSSVSSSKLRAQQPAATTGIHTSEVRQKPLFLSGQMFDIDANGLVEIKTSSPSNAADHDATKQTQQPPKGPQYRIASILPFDMFPQTSSIENVVVLVRTGD
ncbi:S-adenosyl-L-methionine-dependent methyltransferase [Entophlyctis helioformis]|nr:S-adenosyl-L-methionine-dependent methyltransferase [Entophlyctis helioformis]